MSDTNVDRAVAALAAGRFVLVADHHDRENEGDLILAAEKATQEKVAFMVRHTSGLICVALEGIRLDELGLPLMVTENTESHKTAFTVSVDYLAGTTTGISAADRTATILAVVAAGTRPSDLGRPGHVFPLRYGDGGVLTRPGHTEAAVDLARLAGLYPAGVLAEIVNDDGTMARGDQLTRFGARHDIAMITIDELITHRWKTESLVSREAAAELPTPWGEFTAYGYRAAHDGSEHIVLVRGEVAGKHGVLARIHSECLTGDVFASDRCDCGPQLQEAMRIIGDEGCGVVVYNRQHEGRGIGLLDKLKAYRLQDQGLDTVQANISLGHPPDARHYGIEAQILHDLKAESFRLLTNNPDKITQLRKFGVDVIARIPIEVASTSYNKGYLAAKATKLGHLIYGSDSGSAS